MPLPERCWTVSCARCDVLIGVVDGRRFIHNPACAQPLAIGRGTMRCCQCGGDLTVTEQPGTGAVAEAEDDDLELDEPEVDDEPSVRLLPFEPSPRTREARRGR